MLASTNTIRDILSPEFLSKWQSDRPRPLFDDSPILSLHVPKTAGSAFADFMIEVLGRFFTIEYDRIDASLEDFLARAHEFRVGNGHIEWPHVAQAIAHPQKLHIVTLLREPVQRAISNYTYCFSEKHPDHPQFRRAFPTIDTYIDWGGMSKNFQTRVIAGPEVQSPEDAIERIESTYSFVGLTELFNVSSFLFSLAFGCPFSLPTRMINAAKDRKQAEHDISESALDRIRTQNDLDTPVYEHFKRKYEEHMDAIVTLAMRSSNWTNDEVR